METLMISMEEASKMTGLSKSTLYKMTSTRSIGFYKPSGKLIFFTRDQLEELMTRNRIKSKKELENEMFAQLDRKQPNNPNHNQ